MHTLIAAILAVVALTTVPAKARATTFVVNSTDDGTPHSCDAKIGECTLREAILAAIATPGRDTIAFEPSVFPIETPRIVSVGSALPAIADPAGTVIDGAGAGVVIEFDPWVGGGDPVDGLVFTSAPGVALVKPTVANVTVRSFTGSGIVVCGGTLPSCDDDLSTVLVQNVVATQSGANGIRFDGRADTKIRIVDSVVSHNGGNGIDGNGGQSVNGVRIERCTAHANDGSGFSLNAAGEAVGTVIADAIAVQNLGDGFDVNAGQRTTKTKLVDITARGNAIRGVSVSAGSAVTDVAIANALSSQNASAGIDLSAGDVVTAVLKDVAANNNSGSGIFLSSGGTVGASITRAVAAGNQFTGIGLRRGSGIQIRQAVVTENGDDGVYLQASQSSVKQVRASGNGGAGIRLDAPGSGNTITNCALFANDGPAGLFVDTGNTGNDIEKSVSLANDGNDLFDGNVSCTNVYKKNVYRTGSVECQ